MSSYRGLHEILTQRTWDIQPDALFAFKELIDKNMSGHIPYMMEHERLLKPYFISSRDRFREQIYVGTARYIKWYEDLHDDDQIINVVSINGPITRNGGACSYGSKEVRDFLMQAADMSQVIGHIILIDSPGGSSQAKYDFEQAISYIREKKQPVIALVDGMACSAAYALASLCNEIYVVNGKDEVGCIGTMAAFYYTPDGAQDEQTKSIFIERYAEGSPYKNKVIRDLYDGNDTPLMEDLDKSADDFKAMLRNYRNQVTEEQMLGATFLAEEVVGTLVDGIGTMQECIDRVISLSDSGYGQGEEPVKEDPDGQEEPLTEEPEDDPKDTNQPNHINNENQQEMSKSYEKIQSACGAGALESDKNGLYLQSAYCEKLEEFIAQAEQKAETLDAKMQEISDLNNVIAKLKSEHADALEALKSGYEAKLTELGDRLKQSSDEAAKEKQELEASLKEANDKLAEKENELDEMAKTATQSPKPAAPKSDGMDAGLKPASPLVCSSEKSAEENRKALKERMEKLRRQRNG